MVKLSDQRQLLTRDEFKRQVFARSKGLCVFCGKPAVDPHHILERKLFVDHGYYWENGAAVCEEHHWQCETTELPIAKVREAAGITTTLLPPGVPEGAEVDKWGNRVWPSGLRSWGSLEHDTGARKALQLGGILGLMMPGTYVES